MNNLILKIIILYNYKHRFNYKDVIYDNILFIDNSPFPNDKLKELNNYFHFPNNPGLSYAYNFAVKYAKENGYKWILIKDQDTIFPKESLDIYKNAINNNTEIKLFCPKLKIKSGKFMSPVPMNHYYCKLEDDVPDGIIDLSKYAIINSGLLINIDAFLEVGGYNEKVWLDYADFQFIERFSQKFKNGFVVDLTLEQSFSNEEHTISQKLNRFKSFCSSTKHYTPVKKHNKLWIHISVLKRTISLIIESKSIKPLKIFLYNYLK